eukprot:351570-Chlamydomonas_euryale.AAC.8
MRSRPPQAQGCDQRMSTAGARKSTAGRLADVITDALKAAPRTPQERAYDAAGESWPGQMPS